MLAIAGHVCQYCLGVARRDLDTTLNIELETSAISITIESVIKNMCYKNRNMFYEISNARLLQNLY